MWKLFWRKWKWNNNCLSCNKEPKHKHPSNASNLGKNCVEECPEGTILDKDNYQCIKNEENNENNNNDYAYIIVGVVGGIIIIAVVVLIILLHSKRKIE